MMASVTKLGARATPLSSNLPAFAAKLNEQGAKERKFEEMVKSAERAAVLVLVY
jgi:hypothetical protein